MNQRASLGRDDRSGFTLVELLVTISIIIFLAGLTLGAAATLSARANRKYADALIEKTQLVLEEYLDGVGEYPAEMLTLPEGTPALTPAHYTAFKTCNSWVAGVAMDSEQFAMGKDIIESPSGSGTYYLVDRWYSAGNADHDGLGAGEELDGKYGFINVMLGGHNEPALDIWSNGPDGVNDYNPLDANDHGDDVVNWGRR